MRYIKLYENYESYQEITEDEYYAKTLFGSNSNNEDPLEDSNYIINNWESYNRDELKEILTILPKGTKFTINAAINPMYPKSKLDIMNVRDTSLNCYTPDPSGSKDTFFSKLDFFIVKLKDEWYYLYVNHHLLPDKFWKCDQLNGLIKCMRKYL